MDPHTGNVLLGYARLNVPGGLQKLFANPLDDDWFAKPALIDMTSGLDVRTAWYDDAAAALHLGFRPGRSTAANAELTIANVWDRGSWVARVNDIIIATGDERQVLRASQPALARRDGDQLVLELPAVPEMKLDIVWDA